MKQGAATGIPSEGSRPVKGVVLAAGLGQRMGPITQSIPKALLKVGSLPLIGYSLKLLSYHGICDVMINLHHLAQPIQQTLQAGKAYGMNIRYSVEEVLLGTGGGLKRMQAHMDTTTVVLNSDTVVDVDLKRLLAQHRARGALASLALRKTSQPHLRRVAMDDHGRVVKILDQTAPGPWAHGTCASYMFAGLHILEPRFVSYLPHDRPDNRPSCIIRHAYRNALRCGELIYGCLVEGYWADAGMPQAYFQANADALAQRMGLRYADPLEGCPLVLPGDRTCGVWMGRGVKLGEGVHIAPPVLLGDGVTLEDRVTLGPCSVLGAGVHVGQGAQVRQSILWEKTRIQAGSLVDQRLVGLHAALDLSPSQALTS